MTSRIGFPRLNPHALETFETEVSPVPSFREVFQRQIQRLDDQSRAATVLERLNQDLRPRRVSSRAQEFINLSQVTTDEFLSDLLDEPDRLEKVIRGLHLEIPALMPLIQQMQTRIDQKAVRKTLQEVPIPLPQLWPYIIFSPEGYHHVWLWCQKGFEIILLCWLEGQETPIHDHAGSRGLDLVRLGKMWEKVFEEKEGGHLVERTTNTLIAGGIGVIGPHLIHQTGNMGPGRLLSLHIYWRPIDRRRVRTDQPALNQESDTGRRWR